MSSGASLGFSGISRFQHCISALFHDDCRMFSGILSTQNFKISRKLSPVSRNFKFSEVQFCNLHDNCRRLASITRFQICIFSHYQVCSIESLAPVVHLSPLPPEGFRRPSAVHPRFRARCFPFSQDCSTPGGTHHSAHALGTVSD